MALVLACLPAARAAADTRTYVLAIGNNAPPHDPTESAGEALSPLRYADDDAADFFLFSRDSSQASVLLTVLDADSQRRFPGLAEAARAPTLAELRGVVANFKQRFEEDRRLGHDPVLILFYSGHGTRGEAGRASLALLDGPLTKEVLYQEVLGVLPARYVHILVDACHAEAVVRPRDTSADTVPVTEEDAASYAARTTLDRFPHVGAVIATSAAAQSHEWDLYQRGVFSHEVLSGLRGAADVNTDGLVEYSELAAFLGAANREVADPRARLSVVVRPPALNRRAPIVDTRRMGRVARLVGRPAGLGALHVEDERGNRLADLRAEPAFRVSLVLPPDGRLFVRGRDGEAALLPKSGELVELERLVFRPLATAPRGSVDHSLHQGLFAAQYGPRYYRGFVDQNEELPGVVVREEGDGLDPEVVRRRMRPAIVLVAAGVALLAAGVALGVGAFDAAAAWDRTSLERPAAEARARAIGFAIGGVLSLGGAAVTGGLGAARFKRVRAAY